MKKNFVTIQELAYHLLCSEEKIMEILKSGDLDQPILRGKESYLKHLDFVAEHFGIDSEDTKALLELEEVNDISISLGDVLEMLNNPTIKFGPEACN